MTSQYEGSQWHKVPRKRYSYVQSSFELEGSTSIPLIDSSLALIATRRKKHPREGRGCTFFSLHLTRDNAEFLETELGSFVLSESHVIRRRALSIFRQFSPLQQ
jgi:hypothetical protein